MIHSVVGTPQFGMVELSWTAKTTIYYNNFASNLCNKTPQGFFVIVLTSDDSLPLPQRVGHAVDIVVDVVGGSGQLLHLRLEIINAL